MSRITDTDILIVLVDIQNSPVKRKILLAAPRGFCAGVVRAIDIVNLALERHGTPLYVRKEIVHNRHVVDELRSKGVHFVEELSEVPDGALVVFSAHGVAPSVRAEARERSLRVIDATCPLVTKVHNEAARYAGRGDTVVLIGHENHDEVVGTRGEAPQSTVVVGSPEEADRLEIPDSERVAHITQTTLSLDDAREIIERLRQRFPMIKGPAASDICYATQNRQNAVLNLARAAEIVLVVGSANSSNSCRLVEVAQHAGSKAYLIDDTDDVRAEWLEGVDIVGLTAGASAPEMLVSRVIDFLKASGFDEVEEIDGIHENVEFALPAELVAIT